jgi:hypothetical protein
MFNEALKKAQMKVIKYESRFKTPKVSSHTTSYGLQ